MLPRTLRSEPRPLDEIVRLIEVYLSEWRRWCSAPEKGGCACMGCVRQPAPSTVRGDPEYCEWPDERDALIQQEVDMYHAAKRMMDAEYWHRCALWMADVIAATADHAIGLKSTARSEKQRHARIAALVVSALNGRFCPEPRPQDVIVKRLQAVPAADTL